LDVIMEAIAAAGYRPGEDVRLALDVASTELFRDGRYHFPGEGVTRTAEEMIEVYREHISEYPIVAIEDTLSEDVWDEGNALTQAIGDRVLRVGADLLVTTTKWLARGYQ